MTVPRDFSLRKYRHHIYLKKTKKKTIDPCRGYGAVLLFFFFFYVSLPPSWKRNNPQPARDDAGHFITRRRCWYDIIIIVIIMIVLYYWIVYTSRSVGESLRFGFCFLLKNYQIFNSSAMRRNSFISYPEQMLSKCFTLAVNTVGEKWKTKRRRKFNLQMNGHAEKWPETIKWTDKVSRVQYAPTHGAREDIRLRLWWPRGYFVPWFRLACGTSVGGQFCKTERNNNIVPLRNYSNALRQGVNTVGQKRKTKRRRKFGRLETNGCGKMTGNDKKERRNPLSATETRRKARGKDFFFLPPDSVSNARRWRTDRGEGEGLVYYLYARVNIL